MASISEYAVDRSCWLSCKLFLIESASVWLSLRALSNAFSDSLVLLSSETTLSSRWDRSKASCCADFVATCDMSSWRCSDSASSLAVLRAPVLSSIFWSHSFSFCIQEAERLAMRALIVSAFTWRSFLERSNCCQTFMISDCIFRTSVSEFAWAVAMARSCLSTSALKFEHALWLCSNASKSLASSPRAAFTSAFDATSCFSRLATLSSASWRRALVCLSA
mmetsp:Transcript_39599/g.61769  ORF Transcript_39599/g.61769 Transcript_39599/m.61769 type:complete len:221 (-) Transcript_39599:1489-2151(-)